MYFIFNRFSTYHKTLQSKQSIKDKKMIENEKEKYLCLSLEAKIEVNKKENQKLLYKVLFKEQ